MERIAFILSIIILTLFYVGKAPARDLGQWKNVDQKTRDWYAHLMQPDNPTVSCCGEGDAYWCDTVYVREGHTYCKITDDRPDAPLRRAHIPLGTEIPIPDEKLTWKDGNPTGHAIVFVRVSPGGYTSGSIWVYCFVQGTGT